MLSLSKHLPYHFFKQPELSFEGRIFNIGIKPGWSLHHSFTVTESFKRVSAMILANPAVTPTPKWQVMIGQVPA